MILSRVPNRAPNTNTPPVLGVNKHASGYVPAIQVTQKSIPERTSDHCGVRGTHTDKPKPFSNQDVMYVAEIAMFSDKLLEIDLSPLVPNKQRVLTPGHQGWNDLHSLCRIGMGYYLLNDDDNNNNKNNNNANNNNNNNNNDDDNEW